MEEVRLEEEKARDARRGRALARAGRGEYAHRRLSLRPVRSHVGFMMKGARFWKRWMGAMVVGVWMVDS